MLKLIIYGLLCTVLLSCSHDDDVITLPTNNRKYAYLQVGLGQPVTYATTPASEAEKEIGSVAFFVQTKSGEFSKYLSTESLNSEHGLSTALSGSNGSYRASVKIKANDFSGATQIIVICNYEKNRLTEKLLVVNTLDELQNLQSNAIDDNGAMPPLPLLMYAHETDINLMAESSTNITLTPKRMAARVDVIGSSDVQVISAQVLNPKSATYLLSVENDNRTALLPLVDFSLINTVVNNSITLYTYECGASDSPTIQVVYKFGADTLIKNFTFTKGIVRNSYYKIDIKVLTFYPTPDPGWEDEDLETTS